MADPNAVVPVSELNRRVRLALEEEFPLLWVAGEVSNLTRAASGHVYFSLKDASAQARCVMFRSRAQVVPWRLENGQQVEARTLVSLYEPRGEFQLTVEGLRRAGLGRLFEAFAQLRTRLEAEGLFRAEHKRPIPRFPRRIGLISSPHAAALQDVLAAVRRRAPHLSAVLYPTLVQGEAAAASIAEAIGVAVRRKECDLLLIVRGGGSMEDLWSFNEEIVARAIAASPLPTICGVGHETDTTIADCVADFRAATPTAAAEIATQGWFEAVGETVALGRTLARTMESRIAVHQQALDRLSMRLVHPATRTERARSTVTLLGSRLDAALALRLNGHQQRLNGTALALGRNSPRTEERRGRAMLLFQRLESALRNQHLKRIHAIGNIAAALAHLNPEATLARGFSIVRDTGGRVILDATGMLVGQTVSIQLAKGKAEAGILAIESDPHKIAN